MKKSGKKIKGVVKGAPSGFVISILIHAAAFLLAGMLVVFNVVKKEEKQFLPPKPIERPKMNLKKPKVKIKKSSKPKPTTRIVTKMKRASMPEIQLPEMSSMSDGLTGGIGGFDLMPDLANSVTVFGGGQSVGNDFVGTFYDMKRNSRGGGAPMGTEQFLGVIEGFVRSGWKTSKFARYYKSPNKLYATTFMVPPNLSVLGPEAFGEPDVGGWCWCAHYKGQLVHKDGIKFRFWGVGDDILLVRVNGKIVLNGSWYDHNGGDKWNTKFVIGTKWQSSAADSERYNMGCMFGEIGDWITLEPGVPLDMEVLIGEVPGGGFGAMLCVEEEGVDYPIKKDGGPTLPMFKTSEPSLDLVDVIYNDLIPGEACVTNGPVFCDYNSSVKVAEVEQEAPTKPVFAREGEPEIRTWTLSDGKNLDAAFVTSMGDKVVLKNARGKQKKILFSQLAAEDQEFVELANPPRFSIDFIKSSKQKFFIESPEIPGLTPDQLDYVFGARVKQKSTGQYDHELKVEFFAIGDEIDGDNFVLLDRQKSLFTPARENIRSHEFHGESVVVRETEIIPVFGRRGVKFGGNMVVVSDKRGEIVDYSASSDWLLGVIPQLRNLPIGKHFNKTGSRVHPPRQKIPMNPESSY